MKGRTIISAVAAAIVGLCAAAGLQAEETAPGVTASEIKIGNTMPYSGPASSYSSTGKVFEAYFRKINDAGGINGRKLTLLSLDDGLSPPKTMEATRRLVEGDGVAFMFGTLGTQTSLSIARYLNNKKVPQLFAITSSSKLNDPEHLPWSIALPWSPTFYDEAMMDVAYARSKNKDARFAILYQNDDAGRDYLRGVKDVLGADAAGLISLALPFDVADPTVDSQVLSLANTKADVFLIYSVTPRACIQAVKKAFATEWRPLRFVTSACANREIVMLPAGAEASKGTLSLAALRPFQADSKDDKAMGDYIAFMKASLPGYEPNNLSTMYGYMVAQALVALLNDCGDDLSRENIMKKATSMQDVRLPMLLPGITLNTSRTDYRPIKDGYVVSFDGDAWNVVSDLIKGK